MKNELKASILCALAVLTMSACAKDVECDEEIVHCHEYVDRETGIKRYFESEKEYIRSYDRTDEYIYRDDEIKYITKKGFCFVNRNEEVIKNIMSGYSDEREAYIYRRRYGYHYEYVYDEEKAEYSYENVYGPYWDYEWEQISPYEYTEDKVRDIHYTFRFYKMSTDGKIKEYRDFDTLDEVPSEYSYFKVSDLVVKNYSREYYLDKNDYLDNEYYNLIR